MMKFKIAVFIGRFQPFHKGHWWSLQQALRLAERVVLMVGSIQEVGTENNPWSFKERKKMIVSALENLSTVEQKKVVGVVGVKDYPLDEEWVEAVKQKIVKLVGEVKDWSQVVVVGNNDWTNQTLKEIGGLTVWESGLYERELYEGRKIREMMRRGDERWKTRCLSIGS